MREGTTRVLTCIGLLPAIRANVAVHAESKLGKQGSENLGLKRSAALAAVVIDFRSGFSLDSEKMICQGAQAKVVKTETRQTKQIELHAAAEFDSGSDLLAVFCACTLIQIGCIQVAFPKSFGMKVGSSLHCRNLPGD